jgi:hypothetical protein
MSGNADRFHIPTGDEINDLLFAKDAENTKKSTNLSVKYLRDFTTATEREVDLEACVKAGHLLKEFYVGARKINGDRLKKNSATKH